MRTLVLALVLIAACKAQGDDAYPIMVGGGGGGGGGGGHRDAALDTLDADGLLGQVCLVADARFLDICATTGADGLTVTLDGTNLATTATDGTFALPLPDGTDLVWSVTGTAIVSSVMPFGTVPIIPAITTANYMLMLGNNGANINQDEGSVFARVIETGAPLVNAKGVTANEDGITYYDSNNINVWGETSTGAQGVIWIPSQPAGTAILSITPAGAMTPTAVGGVPITAGAITFITADIP